MNINLKKTLKYAAKLCIFGALALMILKFGFGMNIGKNVVPIFALCVMANGISYLLYKPK